MSIIWSVVWGLLAFTIMSITIKYYLPWLSERAQVPASGAHASSGDSEESFEIVPVNKGKYNNEILNQRVLAILMLAVCTCFAAWCGYTASERPVSVMDLLKMTLAMGVFSCVFITDMELMTIPNLCSIVLIAGRLMTVICEFIWTRDEAVAWLINSVIASVVSLLLLLIMTKVTHGGLGMGDVKLFSSFGFLCGVKAACLTLRLSFFLCALTSTGLLVAKKKHLQDSLPLGPFIWMGYGVTVLLSSIM